MPHSEATLREEERRKSRKNQRGKEKRMEEKVREEDIPEISLGCNKSCANVSKVREMP